MNRTVAAIILGLSVNGAAFVADRSKDETQVVPSREALPAKPDLENLDANAQRQHDRDRDANLSKESGAAERTGNVAAARNPQLGPDRPQQRQSGRARRDAGRTWISTLAHRPRSKSR
jgi:hypothetical protein